jgi:hypothetical protein
VFFTDASFANPVAGGTIPAANTSWYHLLMYHDSVNDVVGIRVNGGTPVTVTTGGKTPLGSTAEFRVGGREISPESHVDGRIDSVAFGKSPPGGIASILSTLTSRLYNGGSGLVYDDLSGDEKTAWGLVSWWNLDELSGNRNDSHGTNHLTSNNSVGYDGGIASGAARLDGDPITTWQDQSSTGNHVTQATSTKRPTLKLGVQNGKPVVRFDGVDDFLAKTVSYSGAALTVVWVANSTGNGPGGRGYLCGGGGSNRGIGFNPSGAPPTGLYGNGTNLLFTSPGVAFAVYSGKINGASSTVRKNGSNIASGTVGSLSWDAINIGDDGSAIRCFQGDLGEFMLFDRALSLSEEQSLEGYLNARWGCY